MQATGQDARNSCRLVVKPVDELEHPDSRGIVNSTDDAGPGASCSAAQQQQASRVVTSSMKGLSSTAAAAGANCARGAGEAVRVQRQHQDDMYSPIPAPQLQIHACAPMQRAHAAASLSPPQQHMLQQHGGRHSAYYSYHLGMPPWMLPADPAAAAPDAAAQGAALLPPTVRVHSPAAARARPVAAGQPELVAATCGPCSRAHAGSAALILAASEAAEAQRAQPSSPRDAKTADRAGRVATGAHCGGNNACEGHMSNRGAGPSRVRRKTVKAAEMAALDPLMGEDDQIDSDLAAEAPTNASAGALHTQVP